MSSAAVEHSIGYVPSAEEMAAYLGIRLAGLVGPSARAGDARQEASLGAAIVANKPPWLRPGPVVQSYVAFEMASARFAAFLRADREGPQQVVTTELLAEAVEIMDRWRSCMRGFHEVFATSNTASSPIPTLLARFAPRARPAQTPAPATVNPNYRPQSELALAAIAAHPLLSPRLYAWAVAADPVAFASNPAMATLAEADPGFFEALPCSACGMLLRAASLPRAVLALTHARAEREWQHATHDRRVLHGLWLMLEGSRMHVSVAGEISPTSDWPEQLSRWYRGQDLIDSGRRFRKMGRQWMLPDRDPEQLATFAVSNADWTVRLFCALSSHLSPGAALSSRRVDILASLAEDGHVWVRAAARRRLADPRWNIDAFQFREEHEVAGPSAVDQARIRAITALPPLPRSAAAGAAAPAA